MQLARCFVAMLGLSLLLESSALAASSKGKELFKPCTSCHGAKGQGEFDYDAPAISGLPKWYITSQLQKFKSGARGKHPWDDPGIKMASMARTLRSDEYIELVAQYVSELPKQKLKHSIKGDPKNGRRIYGLCSACHGPSASGNEGVQAPPLVGQNDWYLKRQLLNFRDGVRGGDASVDPLGSTMAASVQSQFAGKEGEKAINDVIDYILALQNERGEDRK